MARLLVVALLVCVGIGACHGFWPPFKCKSGKLTDLLYRCNGVDDCGDNSDETGCDVLFAAIPSTALPFGATVTARVLYAQEQGSIELHLCGSQHCVHMRFWGWGRDGKLGYEKGLRCNSRGRACDYEVHGDWMRNLPAGEFVLVVQFRDDGNDGNGTLAVWLQGKPDDVMVVPYVPQDYNTLRIRPNYFVSDMPVQFISGTETVSVPLGVPLDSATQALVRVNSMLTPDSGRGGVTVSLCGATSCCAVFLTGLYNNELRAQTSTLPYTNTLSPSPRVGQNVFQYNGPSFWEPTNLSLVVQNGHHLLGVWQESAAESDRMWVQCPQDAKYLHVYSNAVGSTQIYLGNKNEKGYSKVAAGPALQPGELASLNVTVYVSASYYLYVGLCGDDSCASVTISAPSGTTFTYRSGLTSNNMPDSTVTSVYQNNLASRTFPAGFTFNVSVALHPDRFLQVWIPSDMSVILTLPIPDAIWNTLPSLKVSFDSGYVTCTSMGLQTLRSLPNPYITLLHSNATLPAKQRRG